MVEGASDKNGASQQWVVMMILVLSVLHVRVNARQHEPMRFRHNRIAPPYEPRHRGTSRFHYEDLMKHEYKTVEENSKVASRFKKLDKLLHSLPRQRSSEGAVTPPPDVVVAAIPSRLTWQVATENPRQMTFDVDAEQTLGDAFHVDELEEEKPTEESEWVNNVESDTHWIVVPTKTDLNSTTTNATSTPTTTTSTEITTTISQENNMQNPSIHRGESNSALVPMHPSAQFTMRHRKFPLTQEEINNKKEEKKSVQNHIERMKKEGLCKVPRAKVIHIKDVYPHTSKTYVPHCTILHQCGAETGCCFDERYTCRAKSTKLVTQHFYTHVDYIQKIERLEFYNHTECECQARDDRPSNDAAMLNMPVLTKDVQPAAKPIAPLCVCPKKFSVRYLPDGTCICDCFHLQKDCLKLKRGKDYFTREDQLCIKMSTCLLPSCEYGHYLRKNARCVRKQEMFAYWPKYSVKDIDNDKY